VPVLHDFHMVVDVFRLVIVPLHDGPPIERVVPVQHGLFVYDSMLVNRQVAVVHGQLVQDQPIVVHDPGGRDYLGMVHHVLVTDRLRGVDHLARLKTAATPGAGAPVMIILGIGRIDDRAAESNDQAAQQQYYSGEHDVILAMAAKATSREARRNFPLSLRQ
jgi:hypothetical protein